MTERDFADAAIALHAASVRFRAMRPKTHSRFERSRAFTEVRCREEDLTAIAKIFFAEDIHMQSFTCQVDATEMVQVRWIPDNEIPAYVQIDIVRNRVIGQPAPPTMDTLALWEAIGHVG